MYHLIYTNTPEFTRVISDVLNKCYPGLLCGSAVSIFSPTCIEPGMRTIDNLSRHICASAGLEERLFGEVIKKSAYEAVLGLYPRDCELKEILSNYFTRHGISRKSPSSKVKPNSSHAAVAYLINEGLINGLVTTNYDTCFEQSYLELSGNPANVIIERKKTEIDFHKAIYKIHGCANKGGMIYRIDQEGSLPRWKKDYLKRTLGETVVIMGYSGQDFDICPALKKINFKRIYWVAFPIEGRPSLTPQAEAFLCDPDKETTVICGDMRDVLAGWSGKHIAQDVPQAPFLLSKILIDALSQQERRLWAARLFGFFGVPSGTVAAITKEKASLPPYNKMSLEFRDTELTVMEHTGRYYDHAARSAELASEPGISLQTKIKFTIGEAGCAAMGAYYDRARDALERAKSLCSKLEDKNHILQTRCRIAWNETVIDGDMLDLSDEDTVQKHFKKIRKIKAKAEKVGNYILSQNCDERVETIKKRRGMSVEEADMEGDETGSLMMQMGLHVGYVTALKTRIERTRKKEWVDKLIDELDNIKLYGRHVTLWRSYKLLMNFEPCKSKRIEYYKFFENQIDLCQFEQNYINKMKAEAKDAILFPKHLGYK